MKTVIIKLYATNTDCLFHDIRTDAIKDNLPQVRALAAEEGTTLYFHYLSSAVFYYGNSTAEVLYTENLTEKEKEAYINFLKKCTVSPSYDESDPEGGWYETPTLSLVRFTKITAEELLFLT